MRARRVRERAIHTALSGPAAGVMGAHYLAQAAGFDKIIALDMGGTSTDVALISGQPEPRPESAIDGLPLRVRMLDIETIGAGGGSIARADAGGALRVGPESAGAKPGPAVYGLGGERATISDANAILGRLDAERFLGGNMTLDLGAGERALAELGGQIAFNLVETAKGVVDIANVNIDRAIRQVSIARGNDPRDFTLVAFGGAGPLHACEAADRLDIPRVLAPPAPGVLCALGLLIADVAVDFSQSVMRQASAESLADLAESESRLLKAARRELAQEGIAPDDTVLTSTLEMRYEGQAYELSVPLSADAIEQFHLAHERSYGHAMRWRAVETVNLRVRGIGIIDKPDIERAEDRWHWPSPFAEKASPLGGSIKLFERDALKAGAIFSGEALVFQMDSTTYVPAGWNARVDGFMNLVLERD